eukprot:5691406-Pyramimonas_sp.AAC.1
MRLYAAGRDRAQASTEARPDEVFAPAPAAAPACEPVLQLPAEGFEAYRDMGCSFNGRPMLHATANA